MVHTHVHFASRDLPHPVGNVIIVRLTNGPMSTQNHAHDTGDVVISRVLESSAVGVSSQFVALAEPLRLRIVSVLSRGERCVCTLQEQVSMASKFLSYHLRVLGEAGLVAVTRRGRRMDYRLNQPGFDQMWREVAMVGVPLASLAEPSGSEFYQWFVPTCNDRKKP